METKALPLEVSDLSLEKGTAVIAHAVYNNIDRVNDVARKGMFTKSWTESKAADGSFDIDFYKNHKTDDSPGLIIGLHENDEKAYTAVKFGSHTFGQDTLKQLDEKVIRRASFGYKTVRANILKNGKNTRELKEVKHIETSVLTKISANPRAGVEAVTKSFEGVIYDLKQMNDTEAQFVQDMLGTYNDSIVKCAVFASQLPPSSDLYTVAQYWVGRMNDFITDMKYQFKWNVPQSKALPENAGIDISEHLQNLRKFVRNTTASDDAIKNVEEEIKSIELSLALNTADTQPDGAAPSVSEAEVKAASDEMMLLFFKHFE